jgi:hypothetical protein
MPEVGEHLCSKHEVLSSNPRTIKKMDSGPLSYQISQEQYQN